MAKARGRVTLPEERQGWLRSMLMRHYEGNQAFREDWSLHLSRYKRLIKALVHPSVGAPRHHWAEHYAYADKAWQGLEAAIDWGPVETRVGGERRVSTRGREYMGRQSRNTNLRCYRQELIDLCNKWGLRCDWAPAWIHASCVERVTGSVPAEKLAALDQDSFRLRRVLSLGTWGGDPHVRIDTRIRIDIAYEPWPVDNWRDVEKRIVADTSKLILAEARRQRDEIKAHYRQAGFILQDTESELVTHIHWVYLRICPQEDILRPWSFERIADNYSFGKTTVRDAVLALAREMGITLPKLPSGRVPRYA